MIPAPIRRLVVVGQDAALWLTANVIHSALGAAGIEVTAIELPSMLGAADVYPTLPPLEALHNQLRLDEAALIRAVGGTFTLGQNFADAAGATLPFLHFYGACGRAIDGNDFFPHWLKARGLGLPVGLEDFSLTAAAARQGRLFIPDEESEAYGRSDFGYHLPAVAYTRSLRALAIQDGIAVLPATALEVVRDTQNGRIAAIVLDGRRVDGDLFIDATAEGRLIGDALAVPRESWADYYPGDRVVVASAPKLAAVPPYAEVRAWPQGWAGLYPAQARIHVVQAYSAALCDDDAAVRGATAAVGSPLADVALRAVRAGRRERAWAANCVAIGAAACRFDPIHNIELHAIQLGLIHLLNCFPASADPAAERDEYNRIMRASCERLRDFQSAYYLLNRYQGAFWDRARRSTLPPSLAHSIALFRARGAIAPYEDESFSADSWRALLTGLGLVPDSYSPAVDRTAPEEVKAQFRTTLGFVREQVLRQPSQDAYLATIAGRAHG
jgi:tryptophan halogenase